MPDDTQEQQEQAPEQVESQEQVETTGGDEQSPDGFKSEESKQSLLADLKKARDQVKAFKEAEEQREREKLSDIERAQAERDDFRTKWEQAEQARLRSDIARTKGVDPELLTGATEEEMTAHADRLSHVAGRQACACPEPQSGTGGWRQRARLRG